MGSPPVTCWDSTLVRALLTLNWCFWYVKLIKVSNVLPERLKGNPEPPLSICFYGLNSFLALLIRPDEHFFLLPNQTTDFYWFEASVEAGSSPEISLHSEGLM